MFCHKNPDLTPLALEKTFHGNPGFSFLYSYFRCSPLRLLKTKDTCHNQTQLMIFLIDFATV